MKLLMVSKKRGDVEFILKKILFLCGDLRDVVHSIQCLFFKADMVIANKNIE
jgi:hypothetical protein